MANLSISFPDFVAGTTIVSSQVDQNNTDIVNYINARNAGSSSWDVVSTASLIVTASTSGGVVGLSVANTSNTASSDAKGTWTVAGTSAGDPYLAFVVTSGSTWTLGADNSDSDKFKISLSSALGTNDYLIISPTTTGVYTAASNTNSTTPAGYVGRIIQANVDPGANAPTSTQVGDLTSISLPAGNWAVSVIINWISSGATWTNAFVGVSTTSGNSLTGLTRAVSNVSDGFASSATAITQVSQALPNVIFSLSATTTVYLKYGATYSAGTPIASGSLNAIMLP